MKGAKEPIFPDFNHQSQDSSEMRELKRRIRELEEKIELNKKTREELRRRQQMNLTELKQLKHEYTQLALKRFRNP